MKITKRTTPKFTFTFNQAEAEILRELVACVDSDDAQNKGTAFAEAIADALDEHGVDICGDEGFLFSGALTSAVAT